MGAGLDPAAGQEPAPHEGRDGIIFGSRGKKNRFFRRARVSSAPELQNFRILALILKNEEGKSTGRMG